MSIAKLARSESILLGELRAHGFARGDTEQMRLILEAFENLASPTRRTRRLMRRPYFPDARLFFEITAPTYSHRRDPSDALAIRSQRIRDTPD